MTHRLRCSDQSHLPGRSDPRHRLRRARQTPASLATVSAALIIVTLAAVCATALAAPALAREATPVADTPGSHSLSALAAPVVGSGSWYWPVGTESFGTMSGWLDPRGGSYHVGQDMPASYGHAVYAVGAGTVWKAKADADGYGPGGGPGGVMIIIHATATGEKFRALYGHIQGLRYKDGDRVAAGAVIATINGSSPTHLHFGIHIGGYYPDGNPYRGHVPMTWSDYGGWVDPVKYLKTHEAGHPKGALSVPFSEPEQRFAQLRRTVPSSTRPIVYCDEGCDTAPRLASWLRTKGWSDVTVFASGYSAWLGAGLPVSKGARP